ncbi:MAG: hypothetical protein DYG92_13780 [Leptolyngbya sp. PLA1]|nr:hypothetical protein [Leptolyngbya sp. PLA1]
MTHDDHTFTSDELHAVAMSLDELARSERSLPDGGFESRIAAAAAAASGPGLRLVGTQPASRRPSRYSAGRLSLAAAVALFATLGAALLANRGAARHEAPIASAQQELSDYFLVASLLDDTGRVQTSAVTTQADQLGERVRSDWSVGDDLLSEGAM